VYVSIIYFQKREEVLKDKQQREKEFQELKDRQKKKEQQEFEKVDSGPKIEEVTEEEAEKIKQDHENKTPKSTTPENTKVRCQIHTIGINSIKEYTLYLLINNYIK
jgi:hypothetical protein